MSCMHACRLRPPRSARGVLAGCLTTDAHARTARCAAAQVAEGVATAGVVVSLARKYRVQLPVLTAVAQVLDGNLTPRQAVFAIMNLPQIEEV